MKYLNEVTSKTAKADDIAVFVLVITSSMIFLRAIVPCYCILSRPLVKDRQVSSHRWRGWGGGSVVVKHALNDQICAFNTEYRYFCPHNIHLRASFGSLFKWRPFGQLCWAGTLKAGAPLGLVITVQAYHTIPYYTTSHHSIPRHTIPHHTTPHRPLSLPSKHGRDAQRRHVPAVSSAPTSTGWSWNMSCICISVFVFVYYLCFLRPHFNLI